MKGDFRVCPSCGSRNKPKWDFCARCGESLQGLPLGEPAPVEAIEDDDQTVASAAFPWVTGFGLLAFGALARSGDTAGAARAYEALLVREPQNTQLIHDLASLHQRSGRFDQALPLLRQLTDLRPDDLVLRQELAHTLEKTGDTQAAMVEYEKILAEKPGADATRSLLAEMRFNRGEKNEAIAVMRDGLARDGEAPLLHRGLASLLERTGSAVSIAEAVKEYREYARLAPNAPDAKQLADRADQLERKIAAANPPPS